MIWDVLACIGLCIGLLAIFFAVTRGGLDRWGSGILIVLGSLRVLLKGRQKAGD